jgi:hypothetical protein
MHYDIRGDINRKLRGLEIGGRACYTEAMKKYFRIYLIISFYKSILI